MEQHRYQTWQKQHLQVKLLPAGKQYHSHRRLLSLRIPLMWHLISALRGIMPVPIHILFSHSEWLSTCIGKWRRWAKWVYIYTSTGAFPTTNVQSLITGWMLSIQLQVGSGYYTTNS